MRWLSNGCCMVVETAATVSGLVGDWFTDNGEEDEGYGLWGFFCGGWLCCIPEGTMDDEEVANKLLLLPATRG